MDDFRHVTEILGAKFGDLLTAATQPLVRLVRFLWANWDIAQNYGMQPEKEPEFKPCLENMLSTPDFEFFSLFYLFILAPKPNASSKWNVFSFTWLSWEADIYKETGFIVWAVGILQYRHSQSSSLTENR